jgi:hypothetical protein
LAGLNAAVVKFGFFAHGSDTPSFAVTDPAAIPFARYTHSKEISAALKRHTGYTSVFIGDPRPSSAFWRSLFLHLGVPVYLNTHDAFETDGRIMVISSDGKAGMRTLRLPQRSIVCNLINGKLLAKSTRRYQFSLRRFQTKLLRVLPVANSR